METPTARTTKEEKEHLKIPVRGTNRSFYLHERAGIFYVRTETPRRLRRAHAELPANFVWSTQTSDLKTARIRARDKIEALVTPFVVRDGSPIPNESHRSLIEELTTPQAAPKVKATYQALSSRYQPRKDEVKESTRRRNLRDLHLFAREVTGKESIELLEIGEYINAEAWNRFRDRRERAVAGSEDELRYEQVKKTLAHMAQAIKSVFSPKVMNCYSELELPKEKIEAFRQAARVMVDDEVLGFEPWPVGFIDELEAAAEHELLSPADGVGYRNRNVYLTYLLMSRLGLRNSEVEHAKWDWLEKDWTGKTFFAVRAVRRHHRSKNKKSRSLLLSAELLKLLEPFREGPDAWIIKEPTPTGRYAVTHREINEWLRPKMEARGMVKPKSKEKCAYQLRGHAGSRVWTITGSIEAAAAFLGDTVETTRKNYARWLRPVKALTAEELTQRFDVVAA